MRKAALVIAIVLALVSGAPVSAHDEHTSCKAFGQGAAALAQLQGGVGAFVRSVNTAPGAVADVVAGFHAQACQAEP